jgi:hypothetical protein
VPELPSVDASALVPPALALPFAPPAPELVLAPSVLASALVSAAFADESSLPQAKNQAQPRPAKRNPRVFAIVVEDYTGKGLARYWQ